MKNAKQILGITALTLGIALTGGKALAQGGGGFGGGGGFDPSQMTQMLVDQMRDTLSVTNDEDWKVISPRLRSVIDARTEISMIASRAMMKSMMAGAGGMPGFNLGAPNPDADALQKALDDNAPSAEVKAALAKFRAWKKQKQADLAKAQASLKDILSVRQEAVVEMAGLLD